MIPLNRPYKHRQLEDFDSKALEPRFPNRYIEFTYSSRDGLNLIYQQLFRQYGPIKVAVSPLTCFEALYPIVLNGHTPVYFDINPKTLNIDTTELIKRKDVKAVQLIYLGGDPLDLDLISNWARGEDIIIIEDCAQALGASYNDIQVGNFGDYSVFSLVKNVYAPAGGLLVSKNKITLEQTLQVSFKVLAYKYIKHYLESLSSYHNRLPCLLYEKLLHFRESEEHDSSAMIKTLPKKYSNKIAKYLSDLDDIEKNRLLCAERIISKIDLSKYDIQEELPNSKSNRNRIILISKNRPALDIISDLRVHGVAANNLTQSYLHEFQDSISCNKVLNRFYVERLPVYERLFPYILCIPVSPSLSEEEINHIISITNQVN